MIKKLFRQMSAAQIASAMTTTLCLLIDSIVIGRLIGVEAMSAYGIANPMLIVLSALGLMMTCGVQAYIGKAMGYGDMDGANACYSTSIVLGSALGAAGTLLVFLAGGPLCWLLGAGTPGPENPVFAMTEAYLRGYMLGAPFFFLNQILATYLQVLGKRKLMITSVIVMTITDIGADLLSVYMFDAGMFGIGLASSLSYLAAFAVELGFFLKKGGLFRFRSKSVRSGAAMEIMRDGSPVLINQVFYTLRVFLYNHILLGLAGNAAVAVFSVFSTLANLLYSIGLGAGAVTLMLTSIFYSEKDKRSLYDLIRVMIGHTFLLIASGVALVELFAPSLIRLFLGSNSAVLTMAIPGIRLFILSVTASVLDNVFKNYFQGIGRTRITNLISFLESLGMAIPCVWTISRLLGLTGFWIGTVVSQALTLLTVAILMWRRHGKVAFSAAAFSYLDANFGARSEDCMELPILDAASAVEASRQLWDFCRRKGLSLRTSLLIALSVEELTMNIVQHGLNQGKGTHAIDVRLVTEPERCVIRVRDNCVSFDPTQYLALHQSDDPAAHISLRMVMGLVREAAYVNTLGLNNLTLIL